MKRKILVIAIILIALTTGTSAVLTSCDNEPKTPDLITCDCPDEATHLEVGASNVTCPADKCPHTGDCTEKVNETLNAGGITVIKEPVVSGDDFEVIVAELNIVASPAGFDFGQRENFKTNFPAIYIVKGTGISHKSGSLTIGCKETADSIYDYLVTDNSLVKSHQPKIEWLANNKETRKLSGIRIT